MTADTESGALDQSVGTASGRRAPGRPRSADADAAIVTATLEILADEGYHALSIEAVAARAGVGKATVYRRWASKRELVSDALASLNDGMPEPPSASLPTRARALRVMEHIARKDPESLAGRILPRMLAYRTSHPELFDAYLARVVEPRREVLRQVLRDGVARGEVRPDLDVVLAASTLTAPLLMAAMSRPVGQPVSPSTVERLADLVWPGIATG